MIVCATALPKISSPASAPAPAHADAAIVAKTSPSTEPRVQAARIVAVTRRHWFGPLD